MRTRLTQFSHGAGCGCKLSASDLNQVLHSLKTGKEFPSLVVGHQHSDDAAVIKLSEEQYLVSTTDFFLPIVDDPVDFGRIAAVNAISDIYAMGALPISAIALLGWPTKNLPLEVASQVLSGGQYACHEASIPLAGGHTIEAAEPFFGLAVQGVVTPNNLKTNQGAKAGDRLFLTKPLGIGTLATAEKKGILQQADREQLISTMIKLNSVGTELGKNRQVTAITDVTGFGLMGHLYEMMKASNTAAKVHMSKLPLLGGFQEYLEKGCAPGGSDKNFKSFSKHATFEEACDPKIVTDPQTSGGLLIAIDNEYTSELEEILLQSNCVCSSEIGEVVTVESPAIRLYFQK
jgi:selenide, water dikinase